MCSILKWCCLFVCPVEKENNNLHKAWKRRVNSTISHKLCKVSICSNAQYWFAVQTKYSAEIFTLLISFTSTLAITVFGYECLLFAIFIEETLKQYETLIAWIAKGWMSHIANNEYTFNQFLSGRLLCWCVQLIQSIFVILVQNE